MNALPPLFAPGQRLGRYELLRRLAVGGMAEVYLACADGPGDFRKVVAIKRLLPQHVLDPQLLRMFLDEARLMARLSHPGIPQVTEVDDRADGDVPYFVMEYVHGTDLRAVLNAAAGPLPLEQSLAITAAVAAGLHHAHQHRGNGGLPLEIVHRDVSPSNVLISFDGAVKVTDFGVAKWTEQKSFTHQGQLKGKFAHMSPEQCRGEALDRRSDVFALGTLLYEMTTGQPPFVANSEFELLSQIVSREAPPPPRRPGEVFPPALEAIVMRALRRERGDRYPNAQELQLDLEAFARERRLVLSPVALARYLESLFGAQVSEWREALASGKTLADHLGTEPAGGQAGGARTRTATDASAISASGAQAMRAARGSGSPAAADAGRARRRAAIRRGAIVGAAAVGGLAALLVATEVTSRWQRRSQPHAALPPLGAASQAPAAPMPVPVSGSASHSSRTHATGTRSDGVDRQASRLPVNAVIDAAGVTRSRSEDGPRPTRRAPGVRRRPAPGTSDTVGETAAGSPRPSLVGSGAGPGPDPRHAIMPAHPTAAESEVVPTGAVAGGTGPVGAAAAAAPLKVWDPDSPVPP